MIKTENYKLNRPEETDYYNIEDFNENVDIIDIVLDEHAKHVSNKDNPHDVTKEQVGLGNVTNEAQAPLEHTTDSNAHSTQFNAKQNTIQGGTSGNIMTFSGTAGEINSISQSAFANAAHTHTPAQVGAEPTITTKNNAFNLSLGTTAGGALSSGMTGSAGTSTTHVARSDHTHNMPTIPANTSQLTNNSGFVTSSGVTSVAAGTGLSGGTITSSGTIAMGTPSSCSAATTNSVSGTTHTHAITGIPTHTNQLTNNSGFVTSSGVTSVTAGNGITGGGTGGSVSVSHAAHTGDVTGTTALTIANGAVTSAKLSAGSVGSTQLANGAILPTHISPPPSNSHEPCGALWYKPGRGVYWLRYTNRNDFLQKI